MQASQTQKTLALPETVDGAGYIPGKGVCRNVPDGQWTVDLGSTYNIHQLYLQIGGGKVYGIDIFVSNSSTNYKQTKCGFDNSEIERGGWGGKTILCLHDQPVRYVTADVETSSNYVTICEVSIVGTAAIDCSACPDNSQCDSNGAGCVQCLPGKLLPDCTIYATCDDVDEEFDDEY